MHAPGILRKFKIVAPATPIYNDLQPYLSVFEEKASSMLDHGRLSSTPLLSSSRLSTPPPSLNSGSVR
jgi:hypothetical protein